VSARDEIQALLSAGLTKRDIGRAVGRNDSLIGQIARGAKPGRNLEAALGGLRERVGRLGKSDALAAPEPLPEAPRRVQAVRQAVRHGGNRWSVAGVKAQATSTGAKALQGIIYDADATGRRLSLHLSVNPRLVIARSGGRRIKRAKGRREAQEVRAGDNGRGIDAGMLATLVDSHNGNVTEAIAEYLAVSGYVGAISAADIYSVEVSSWDA
jgi:hypothetical protein